VLADVPLALFKVGAGVTRPSALALPAIEHNLKRANVLDRLELFPTITFGQVNGQGVHAHVESDVGNATHEAENACIPAHRPIRIVGPEILDWLSKLIAPLDRDPRAVDRSRSADLETNLHLFSAELIIARLR